MDARYTPRWLPATRTERFVDVFLSEKIGIWYIKRDERGFDHDRVTLEHAYEEQEVQVRAVEVRLKAARCGTYGEGREV
jgi:hypothetical protein